MNRKNIFTLIALVLLCLTTKPLHAAKIIPLAGEWRSALDRADAGVGEKWFAKVLPDKTKLPGILPAHGDGDDITTNTLWVPGLGDAWWKLQPQNQPACSTRT